MQEDRDEDHEPKLGTNQEGARNRHAVKERVEQQADQRGCAGHGADRVRFLAKVEVRSQRMLRKVNGEIAREDQQRRDSTAARERFR